MNLTKSLSKILKVFSYGERLRPTRDWFVLLGACAVLLIVSVLWNILLFVQLENGRSIGAAASTQTATTTSLTGVQNVFKARAAEEDKYQHTYTFIDPSQ